MKAKMTKLENGYHLIEEGGQRIQKFHPYDRADYFWARLSRDSKCWLLILKGEIKSRIDASVNDVVSEVVRTLTAWNNEIEPEMVHN